MKTGSLGHDRVGPFGYPRPRDPVFYSTILQGIEVVDEGMYHIVTELYEGLLDVLAAYFVCTWSVPIYGIVILPVTGVYAYLLVRLLPCDYRKPH